MARKKAEEKSYPGDGLRTLVDQYDGIQDERISAENRARAIKQGDDTGDATMYARLAEQLKALEKDVAKQFEDAVEDHVIGPWLLSVKGIGPTQAAKLIGTVRDIRRFKTASKLWRYAGYATVPKCLDCDTWVDEIELPSGGKEFLEACQNCGSDNLKNLAERPVKGRKLSYNPRFKTLMYNVADSFLRANSPYRLLYDDAYTYYFNNRPGWSSCEDCGGSALDCENPTEHGDSTYRNRKGKGWTTGRVHMAARRKMIKVFLAHLYEAWRRIDGLVIQPLYVHQVLGHTDRHEPEDFVDYDLPEIKWAKTGP